MISYDDLIDDVMLNFSQGDYEKEAIAAKSEFHKSVGIFDDDSIDLGNKINLFIDWYLFNRKLKSHNLTPIQLVGRDGHFPVRDGLGGLVQNLCSSKQSLFEFIKVKDEDVYVRDLYSEYKMVLKKSPFVVGFSKSEVFSARIFPFEDTFVFSKAFCIHPTQALKFILKEVKKIKKIKGDEQLIQREELIFRLLKMRYKIEQYKHIKIEDIYTDEPKLRI